MAEDLPDLEAAKLIGVRLNKWLARFPFYCMEVHNGDVG